MRPSPRCMVAATILSSCTTAQIPAGEKLTRSYDFQSAQITLSLESDQACFLRGANIRNKSTRPLGYVYSILVVVTMEGRTIRSLSINFPPTVAGGTAAAAHIGPIDADLLGGGPCKDLQLQLALV